MSDRPRSPATSTTLKLPPTVLTDGPEPSRSWGGRKTGS